MTGAEIHHKSVDAGERWLLTDAGGQLLQAWDSRGYTVTAGYDAMRRPTTLEVTDRTDTTRLAEQIIYGETLDTAQTRKPPRRSTCAAPRTSISTKPASPPPRNATSKTTSSLRHANYSPATSTRRLVHQPSPRTDETFTTTNTYDALNRVTTITAPTAASPHPATTNAACWPQSVSTSKAARPTWSPRCPTTPKPSAKPPLTATAPPPPTPMTPTPSASPTSPPAAHRTTATTGRHTNLQRRRTVQNIPYTYDPVGNIVLGQDAALQTIFYDNQIAAPTNDYTYDPIYRLIQASGREHISQTLPQPTWDDAARTQVLPSDIQAMQPYTETYAYDPVGNFQTVTHSAKTGSWTRSYAYDNGHPARQ